MPLQFMFTNHFYKGKEKENIVVVAASHVHLLRMLSAYTHALGIHSMLMCISLDFRGRAVVCCLVGVALDISVYASNVWTT